jgi:hypothetical protein
MDGTEDDIVFDYELLNENVTGDNDENSEVIVLIILTVKNTKKPEAIIFGNNHRFLSFLLFITKKLCVL